MSPRTCGGGTLEFATLLPAAGADPGAHLFMVQSHVPEHAELHYVLECATGSGEAQRMIQFKEKARCQEQVRLSLLTYPVLMASDILLYDTEEVPVGEDQTQHVEQARDVAIRFNHRYGPTFTLPKAINPPVAARIMDLAKPMDKMSESASAAGSLRLLDEPGVLRRKVTPGPPVRPVRRPQAGGGRCRGGDADPGPRRYLELSRDPERILSVLRPSRPLRRGRHPSAQQAQHDRRAVVVTPFNRCARVVRHERPAGLGRNYARSGQVIGFEIQRYTTAQVQGSAPGPTRPESPAVGAGCC